jgi:hypothetical protein
MKTIDTLLEDILALFDQDSGGHIFNDKSDILFAHKFSEQVLARMGPQGERVPTIRMSNIGQPCERKLWYSLNQAEDAIPLTPETRVKFLFGDMYEEFLLFLAEEAGHRVEGRQTQMDVYGVKGHRDAVIDGVLVDVKSASGYGFKKFKEGNVKYDDAFGYIPQLQLYLHASKDDPLVTEKDRAAFWVVDKSSGEMCLDFHDRDDSIDWEEYVHHKRGVEDLEEPPERAFSPVPQYPPSRDGRRPASSNKKLPVNCAYCDFKKVCWPGMRSFEYKGGKVDHLVHIHNLPKVPEISV